MVPIDDAEIIQRVYVPHAQKKFSRLSALSSSDPQASTIQQDVLEALQTEGPLTAPQLRKHLINAAPGRYKRCPFRAEDDDDDSYQKSSHCYIKSYLDCLNNQGILSYGARKTIQKKKQSPKKNATSESWRAVSYHWGLSSAPSLPSERNQA